MAEAWIGVVGAAIGALAGIVGGWLTYFLTSRRVRRNEIRDAAADLIANASLPTVISRALELHAFERKRLAELIIPWSEDHACPSETGGACTDGLRTLRLPVATFLGSDERLVGRRHASRQVTSCRGCQHHHRARAGAGTGNKSPAYPARARLTLLQTAYPGSRGVKQGSMGTFPKGRLISRCREPSGSQLDRIVLVLRVRRPSGGPPFARGRLIGRSLTLRLN